MSFKFFFSKTFSPYKNIFFLDACEGQILVSNTSKVLSKDCNNVYSNITFVQFQWKDCSLQYNESRLSTSPLLFSLELTWKSSLSSTELRPLRIRALGAVIVVFWCNYWLAYPFLQCSQPENKIKFIKY